MAYKAPVRDFTFILNEVLEIDRYTNQPGFQDVSSDLVGQILEEGAKFADEVIAPINNPGDKEGCHWAEGGVVTTPRSAHWQPSLSPGLLMGASTSSAKRAPSSRIWPTRSEDTSWKPG